MTDGTTLLQLPQLGWVDFLDDHTAYISVRQDLAAAQVHENVKRARGLTRRTRALLATLPADRTFTFVVDGGRRWPGRAPLPKGSDASMWVRDRPTDGLALDVAAGRQVRGRGAANSRRPSRPQLEALFGDARPRRSASSGSCATKTQVRVTGDLSTVDDRASSRSRAAAVGCRRCPRRPCPPARSSSGSPGAPAPARPRSRTSSRRRCPAAASTIEHDAYYRDQGHLPPEERARINYDHPASLESSLLVEHLRDAARGPRRRRADLRLRDPHPPAPRPAASSPRG